MWYKDEINPITIQNQNGKWMASFVRKCWDDKKAEFG